MISVNNISKSFGSVRAVNDLSFSVKDGEIVGLLGPNGAGKTTTMRVMSGYLFPDGGDVVVNKVSVTENPVEAQKMIGYLPENNPLYKDMLVRDILDVSASLKGISKSGKREALDFVVSSVNIENVYYKPIAELSKGYKQRVGIALVLLHKPEILIMDEPTEGLDPNQRSEIRALIKKLAKNHTIVVSTHVMQEVEAVCSRMVIINNGEKVADGSVEELSRSGKDEKIIYAEIEGKNVKGSLKEIGGIKELDVQTKKTNVFQVKIVSELLAPIQPEISKLSAKNGWIIWRLAEEKRQLEDLFKQLTSGN